MTQINHVRTVPFQMVKDPVENTRINTQIDGWFEYFINFSY